MIEKIKEIITHKWAKELYRILPFLGVAGFVLVPDSSSSVVLFGMGIVFMAILVAHLTRKILFPYFDMAKLVDGIEDDPKASALVIVGLIYLVTSIIHAFVTLLH